LFETTMESIRTIREYYNLINGLWNNRHKFPGADVIRNCLVSWSTFSLQRISAPTHTSLTKINGNGMIQSGMRWS
jgi:hypothetical protein